MALFLQHVGDLGNILADETGRAVFRVEDNLIKVSEQCNVNFLHVYVT